MSDPDRFYPIIISSATRVKYLCLCIILHIKTAVLRWKCYLYGVLYYTQITKLLYSENLRRLHGTKPSTDNIPVNYPLPVYFCAVFLDVNCTISLK